MRRAFALALFFAAAPALAQAPALSEGEVRGIDRMAKEITLRHGPLANLDMPAMTMVFRVADPRLLDKVKEGDRVRFRAEMEGGEVTITHIERALAARRGRDGLGTLSPR